MFYRVNKIEREKIPTMSMRDPWYDALLGDEIPWGYTDIPPIAVGVELQNVMAIMAILGEMDLEGIPSGLASDIKYQIKLWRAVLNKQRRKELKQDREQIEALKKDIRHALDNGMAEIIYYLQ